MLPRTTLTRVTLAVLLGLLHAVTLHAQVSAEPIGNTIRWRAGGGQGPNDTYCTTRVYLDDVLEDSNGNAPPCRTVPLIENFSTCNWTGLHTVRAESGSPYHPSVSWGEVTVLVTEPPPVACNLSTHILHFNIPNDTSERVLLSNLNKTGTAPNYQYPHYQQLLARDKAIFVTLRTIYRGRATAGIPVVVKVLDPPDRSPYIAGGQGVVRPVPGADPNDNAGPLPRILGTGVVDNGDGTYSVTSGAEGFVQLEVELNEGAAAGDNYRLEATATFPDGFTKTETSGEIVAWKRLFLEKRTMFRRGAPLATNAPVGVRTIVVPATPIASSGVAEFRRNDVVMLLHAPAWGAPKSAGSWRSIYTIAERPQRFRAQAPALGPGTVTTNGTAVIVGTGTRFTRLNVGDVISIPNADDVDVRVVVAIADNTHLTVDTPTRSAVANQSYQIGDPNLVPGQYYRRLTLDRPLGESYGREPLERRREVLTLNDAVVRLGGPGVTSEDVFDVSTTLLTGSSAAPWTRAFPAAYTEYVELSSPPLSSSAVPRMLLASAGDPNTQRFIDRWFSLPSAEPLPSTDPDQLYWYRYATPPNHQLLLVGDTTPAGAAMSGSNGFLSRDLPGELASVLNRGTVEYQVAQSNGPLYEADVDTVLQRTLVHEIVHQWWINASVFGITYGDHCVSQVSFDSATDFPTTSGAPPSGVRFCLMTYADGGLTMPAPWNSSVQINMVQYHYRNGHTALHITPHAQEWHSEYVAIRTTPDPWRP